MVVTNHDMELTAFDDGLLQSSTPVIIGIIVAD